MFLYREDEIRSAFAFKGSFKMGAFVIGSLLCVCVCVITCVDVLYGLKNLLLLQTGRIFRVQLALSCVCYFLSTEKNIEFSPRML